MLIKLNAEFTKDINQYNLVLATLNSVDPSGKLTEHSEKVAYTIYKMMQTFSHYSDRDMRIACSFAVMHDIGMAMTVSENEPFKFDEKANLDVFSHSIYGYIIFKYIANYSDMADAILYHHLDFRTSKENVIESMRFASALHIADDFIINDCNLAEIEKFKGNRYNPDTVATLYRALTETNLIEGLHSNLYKEELQKLLGEASYSSMSFKAMLRVFLYAFENKKHNNSELSSYSAYISWIIGDLFNLDDYKKSEVYTAAALQNLDIAASGDNVVNIINRVKAVNISITCDLVLLLSNRLATEIYRIVTLDNSDITPQVVRTAVSNLLDSKDNYNEHFAKLTPVQVDKIARILRPVHGDVQTVLNKIETEYKDKLQFMNSNYLRANIDK